MIAKLNDILAEYIGKYVITVRTLYYQCVARGLIPNTEKDYKWLTELVSDARLAGEMDWDVLTDRGREVLCRSRWEDAPAFIKSVAPQFHHDMWDNQDHRVFVVVEKDALAGVIEAKCREYDVPLLAAKGYPSSSALREMAKQHLIDPASQGQTVVILHMGDHDPSGINMSSDLEDRLRMFISGDVMDGEYGFEFHRIALNMQQVREVNPPPNPAKISDPRAEAYIRQFGRISWELDALSPAYLNELLDQEINMYIDYDNWKARESLKQATVKKLVALEKHL